MSKRNVFSFHRLREPVEKGLAKLITSTVEADKIKLNPYHFKSAQLYDLLAQLYNILMTCSLVKLATVDLQQATMDLLCHCLNCLTSRLATDVVIVPLRNSIFVNLLTHCGKLDRLQVCMLSFVVVVVFLKYLLCHVLTKHRAEMAPRLVC